MAAPSSSSSSGARSSMSRMLASARLSSYHPKISQVYPAPPAYISRGFFVIKRPLPTTHLPLGTIRHVEVSNQDSKEGQTEWREREREVVLLKRFKELGIKVGTSDSKGGLGSGKDDIFSNYLDTSEKRREVKKGSLGPRICTTYDQSTRRPVPSHFDGIPNDKESMRNYLQSEAILGRGPLYMSSLHGEVDGGPFGRASESYTSYPTSRTNFRTMNHNQFERFLEQIRSSRNVFKDHLAAKAAKKARQMVALEYKKQRDLIALEAQKAEETGATKVQVPEEVDENDLPFLARSDEVDENTVHVDLWDELRAFKYDPILWGPWLQGQNSSKVRAPSSELLPPLSNSLGGEEIPTPQHTLGGLQYAQPDNISTQLLNDTIPARAIGKGLKDDARFFTNFSKHNGLDGLSVAVGGRIAYMPYAVSEYAQRLDPSQNDPQAGNIRVRVYKAFREVKKEDEGQDLMFHRYGQRQDDRLPGAFGNTLMAVRSVEGQELNSLAKGNPGSSEWVGRLNGRLGLQSGQGNDQIINLSGYNSTQARERRSFRAGVEGQDSRLSLEERRRKMRKDRLQSTQTSANRKQIDYFKYMMTDKNKEKE